jgi:N utilization substance protein B
LSARGKSRKRALDVLFESELRGLQLDGTLQQRLDAGEPPVSDYTVRLVRGIVDERERIDELISSYAEGWSLGRMPAVDRNALRIGVYELLHVDEVPDAVAVSEAVGLASELSTDESPAFINGILSSILRDKAALRPPPLES